MQRVQPQTVSLSSDGESSKSKKEIPELDTSSFSWEAAIKYFDKEIRLGKWDIYFLDNGEQIKKEGFLTCVTAEICKEFGYELLNVLADLILPVGFGYPTLASDLKVHVENAFKPVSKMGHRKKIVWIEDEQWNNPGDSIVEPLVMQLLLQKGEPFLIAPMKYFDKEALSSVFKVIDAKLEGNDTTAETHWQTFTNLLNFGFLLALRSSKVSLILLHFSQRFAEKVGAFQMLDLADSEGHEIKYFKNDPITERDTKVALFMETLISPSSPSSKKIRL